MDSLSGTIAARRAVALRARAMMVPMVLWVCGSVLLAMGLTRPVIHISVNLGGFLADVLDRQKVVGVMLQEKGINVANLADLVAKLPASAELPQEHSILSSISELTRRQCYTAAGLILLFSVVVPITKQIALLLVMVLPATASRRVNAFTQSIHKWAMLDVFVLAMAVLALSSATAWNASLRDGFYWFLAYFFMTAALGIVLSRQLRVARRPAAEPAVDELART